MLAGIRSQDRTGCMPVIGCRVPNGNDGFIVENPTKIIHRFDCMTAIGCNFCGGSQTIGIGIAYVTNLDIFAIAE